MATSEWSEVPNDLLWKIIERLPVVDYFRFGGVCVSWHAALAEKRHPPLPHLPWLLLPDISDFGTNSPVRTFSLTDDKERHLEIPHYLRRLTCIGSSEGWLLFLDLSTQDSEIFMFDPISRSQATLPSIATLPVPILPVPIPVRYDFPNPHRFMKVVTSHRSFGFIASAIRMRAGSLAMARVGDKLWTTIEFMWGLHRFCDIIFYKEQLWAMTNNGWVVACDLSDVSHPRVMFTVRAPAGLEYEYSDVRQFFCPWYLVQCSGNILLVWRGMREVTDGALSQVWRGASEEIEGEVETTVVKVFKLYLSDKQVSWVDLESLGDHALFLGNNPSIAISSRDLPELRQNCIYLTNVSRIGDSKSDLLIYQMEDKSLQPLLSLGKSKTKRPQMFWWTPNWSVGLPVRTMAPDSGYMVKLLVQQLRGSNSSYKSRVNGESIGSVIYG